jgi:hypothetical protein
LDHIIGGWIEKHSSPIDSSSSALLFLPIACAAFPLLHCSCAEIHQGIIRSSVVNDVMTGLNASPLHFKDWMQHSLLQRRLSPAVYNCYQIQFLNCCRCVVADNSGLSATVLASLLIIGTSSGFHTRTVVDTPSESRVSCSYYKITYSYNSHTSTYLITNHIQAHTQVYIQAHTIIIHNHNKHRYSYI